MVYIICLKRYMLCVGDFIIIELMMNYKFKVFDVLCFCVECRRELNNLIFNVYDF